MARKSTAERLEELIDAAITVFMRVGYRRAQIADIAREMGVAPGTIYLYVESKEALFDLALQHAFGNASPFHADQLPLPTPSTEAILARVRTEFERPTFIPAFNPDFDTAAALDGQTAPDIRSELSGVITELYLRIHRRRLALRIIERSALDWPELLDLFYRKVRADILHQLTRYLELRTAQGKLRRTPDAAASARLILETISWFAYHRAGDPDPDTMTEEVARATVIDALVNAYLIRQ